MKDVVRQSRARRRGPGPGFTLLELLLVVALVSILLGIIVPTYHGVREHARKAKARATVKHLETAFREYYNHYRSWPPAGDGEISGGLYWTLRGDNPDNIAFFEFERIEGAPVPQTAYDPWKYCPAGEVAWRAYRVRFDHNFDNQIDVPWQSDPIYRSVIVWSPGPDREDGTEDDIRSWE